MSNFADLLPGVPLVESPFFLEAMQRWDAGTQAVALHLAVKGYAVVDFPEPDFALIVEDVRRGLLPRLAGPAGENRVVVDAWTDDPGVRRIAANPDVLDLLGALYGRPAVPVRTATFAAVAGQATFADHAQFGPAPERFLCGVLVAMEDIDEGNGAPYCYPGSHKWPAYGYEHIGAPPAAEPGRFVELWEALAAAQSLRRERITLTRGQALILASNLAHGVLPPREPGRTRWSQLTHYCFEGCRYALALQESLVGGPAPPGALRDIRTGAAAAGIGRGPAAVIPAGFDPERYLQLNADVRAAGADPYRHYAVHGRAEGRRW